MSSFASQLIRFFVEVVIVTAALSAPAWWVARRRKTWFAWDYATIVTPFAAWYGAATNGLGAVLSLSNLAAEVSILALLVPLAHSLWVFAVDRWLRSPSRSSIGVFVACTLAAIVIRASMPLLPE